MKKEIALVFGIIFLISFVSSAIGPRCEESIVEENSKFIIQGEVLSSEILETWNSTTGDKKYTTEFAKIKIEIKTLKIIKGDKKEGDIISFTYDTILKNSAGWAGGRYYNKFNEKDLIEYREVNEVIEIDGFPCEASKIQKINQLRDGTGNQTQSQNQNKIKVQNRIQIHNMSGECPNNCSCQGSIVQCQLQGGRQMTVSAGKSGNTIVQTKGQNISTMTELYTEDGIIYGQFKGQTKAINLMPDQIKEKLQQKISTELAEELKIELDENGLYQVQAKKQARFLGMFRVRERVLVEFDPETGEMLQIRNSWWGFLAKDIKGQPLIGASCGTVTPGYNNECCQNKGYNSWDEEKVECVFN